MDYFPFDVDFFEDDKIALIEAEFGWKGVMVAIRLLCKIYKDTGYYYQWGGDECLLLCKQMGAGFVPGAVQEIVAGLVRRSFFDKGVWDSFGILTSAGIQRRYLSMAKDRLPANPVPGIWLLGVSRGETPENEEFSAGKPEFSAGKPDKENKRKENKNKKNSSRTREACSESEENDFYEIFFWRNLQDPRKEVQRFVAYNARFGWKALPTHQDRLDAAQNWKPESEVPRINETLLRRLRSLYERLRSTDPEAASAMLDQRTRGVVLNGKYNIQCDRRLWPYINNNTPEFSGLNCPIIPADLT